MFANHAAKDKYDPHLPVLILKSGARPQHHGTLAIIRSFGRAGVSVYCCTEPGTPPAACSRYLSRDLIGVLPTADRAFAIAELKRFQQRLDRPVAVIPVDDIGALFLAESAGVLGAAFRLPRQPPNLPRKVASKASLPQLCGLTGTPTPGTFVVEPTDDLASATAPMRYPAVAKIAEPWLLPADVRPALLVQNQAEAIEYRSRLGTGPPAAMVVQELIPHEASEDWFYHGYHATGGEPVVGFTGRKLRSYPAFVGATSFGVSLVNKTVRSLSQSLLRELRYAGIVELEFCLDKRDGQYKLIDFNPRLGAQFQLLRNTQGVDVVRAMHLYLSGRAVPDAPQLEGCTFISDFTDMAVLGAYWRRGLLSPGEWLKQVVDAEEHAWFAADDLAPFAAASVHFGASFLAARARKLGRKGDTPSPFATENRPTLHRKLFDRAKLAIRKLASPHVGTQT